MSVRQYIGARYVTKIYENSLDPSSAEWEVGVTYEPLTLVTYLNSSYLSKKEVPGSVGNPAANPSYWVVTGAYNGQIAALDARVTALEGTGRKAIYIGNSYAAGEGTESGNGLYAQTRDLFIDSKLYASGGVGFLTYTSHPTTFLDLLNTAISDSSGIAADEVTDIVIISAWGDTLAIKEGAGIANFESAIQTFVSTAKAAYPNLQHIQLAFSDTRAVRTIPGTPSGDSYFNEPFVTNMVFNRVANVCGIEYLGWIGWKIFMEGSAYMQADNYHPSAVGNLTLSQVLKQAMRGTWIPVPKQASYVLDSEIVSGMTIECDAVIDPTYSELMFKNISANGTTPVQYATVKVASWENVNTIYMVPPALLGYGVSSVSLGNLSFNLHLEDFSQFDTYNSSIVSDDGVLQIMGVAFEASSSITNRTNYSLQQRTLVIRNRI